MLANDMSKNQLVMGKASDNLIENQLVVREASDNLSYPEGD
jgi:hypothetical protein